MAPTPEQTQTLAAGRSPAANSYEPLWLSRCQMSFRIFFLFVTSGNSRHGTKRAPLSAQVGEATVAQPGDQRGMQHVA